MDQLLGLIKMTGTLRCFGLLMLFAAPCSAGEKTNGFEKVDGGSSAAPVVHSTLRVVRYKRWTDHTERVSFEAVSKMPNGENFFQVKVGQRSHFVKMNQSFTAKLRGKDAVLTVVSYDSQSDDRDILKIKSKKGSWTLIKGLPVLSTHSPEVHLCSLDDPQNRFVVFIGSGFGLHGLVYTVVNSYNILLLEDKTGKRFLVPRITPEELKKLKSKAP